MNETKKEYCDYCEELFPIEELKEICIRASTYYEPSEYGYTCVKCESYMQKMEEDHENSLYNQKDDLD